MAQLNRRSALTLAGGTLGASALTIGAYAAGKSAGQGAQTPGAGAPVRIGYLPITDSAPLLLAHAQGYYKQAGVSVAEPIRFRSWASLVEAFVSGSVDVIHLLMPMAVYLRYGLNADAKVVAWNHINGSALTVAPHITDTAQLAGKIVAIPAWFSIHNILLQQVLRAAGLTPVIRSTANAERGEVALVVMAPSDMIPALANGTISGFTVADPFNAAAHLQKVGRIHRFMGDVWQEHACCVTVMRQPLLDRADGAAQAFTDALVRAQVFARENRQEAAKILADGFLPQKPAAIERAMTDHGSEHADALHHPQWGGQLLDFKPYPYASFTGRLVELMADTAVDAPVDFLDSLDPAGVHKDLVEDRLVAASIEKVGGHSVFGAGQGTERNEEVEA